MTFFCCKRNRPMSTKACKNACHLSDVCRIEREKDKEVVKNRAKNYVRIELDMAEVMRLYVEEKWTMKKIAVKLGTNRWTVRLRINEVMNK